MSNYTFNKEEKDKLVQLKKIITNIYGNIKLAVMSILSTLCVCEKIELASLFPLSVTHDTVVFI